MNPLIILSVVLLALPRLSVAAVLLNDNFESYSLGSKPTNPGDGNPNNWVFGATLSPSSVVEGSSPGGSGANQKVLNALDATPGSYGSFSRLFERQTNDGIDDLISLQLKFKVNSLTSSDYMIDLIDSTINSFSGPAVIRISQAGGVMVYTGSGTPVLLDNGSINLTDWYQLSVIMDLGSQTYSVSLGNITTNTPAASLNALPFYTNVHSVNGLLIRSTATNANANLDWLVDDVVVQSIPEPATIALLVAGLVFALVGARGRRVRTS